MSHHNSEFNVGSTGRIQNRLESAISILIIAILLVITASLLVRQSNTDIGRFGVNAINPQLTQKMQIKEESGPAIPLPTGFGRLSEAETYTADNLYEKIDGKAPLYLEAGFLKLYCQRFVNKNDPNLWMEVFIYDMGNVRNAFSVYSMQKRADANTLSGVEPIWGYATSNGAYFVHGKLYVEMVGSADSVELSKAMVETTADIQKKPAAASDMKIAELDLFPVENSIPGSVKLYLKNAFGFEGLSDIFTSQYKIDGRIITVFFGKRPTAQDAEAMAERYRKFLTENDAKIKQTVNELLKDKIFDFYGVTEIVFAKGPFVIGVHEAENQEAAEKVAMMLADRLSANNAAKQ